MDKGLIIIIGMILLVIGGVIYVGIDAGEVRKQAEQKCKSVDMDLLEHQYKSNIDIVINCFKQGTDQIKIFRVEKEKCHKINIK